MPEHWNKLRAVIIKGNETPYKAHIGGKVELELEVQN